MSKAKPSWLRVVMDQASSTRPYKFEDGIVTEPKVLTLDERAAICRRAHGDVEIARAVLEDARNHVVECEGELMKAELALEREHKEFTAAAAEKCRVKKGD